MPRKKMFVEESESIFLIPYFCVVCHKEIYPGPEYAYYVKPKDNHKYCCSYTCWRKATPDMGQRKKRLTKEEQDGVVQLIRQGMTDLEIARRFDTSSSVVAYYKKKMMEELMNANQGQDQAGRSQP